MGNYGTFIQWTNTHQFKKEPISNNHNIVGKSDRHLKASQKQKEYDFIFMKF